MKKIIYATALSLTLGSLHAQNVSSYTFQQYSGTYTPIVGTTVAASEDINTIVDDDSYPVTIPFSFSFAGGSYTTANISANGTVSFGTNDQTDYEAIAGESIGSGIIAAMNTDIVGLYLTYGTHTAGSNVITGLSNTSMFSVGQMIGGEFFSDLVEITAVTATTITVSATALDSGEGQIGSFTGRIATEVSGTSPNRVFTIQWSDFSYYNSGNSLIDFQVKLYEGGGSSTGQKAEVVYGDFETYDFISEAVQIGLRGMTNTDFNNRKTGADWTNTLAGTQASDYVDVDETDLPPSGLTFTWTPPVCIAPSVFIGNDTATCIGDDIVLMSNYPNDQNLWSNGTTAPTLSVQAGTYYLTVTVEGGCTGSDTIVVTNVPAANAGSITVGGTSPAFTFQATGVTGGATTVFNYGDGSAPVSGTLNGSHTYTANGTYTVSFVATNACGYADTTTTTVTVSGLGIATTANSATGLRIFPNPATSTATISVTNGRINTVEVVDAIGRVAMTQSVNALSSTLKVGGLSSGVYTLRIQTNAGTLYSKLEVAK